MFLQKLTFDFTLFWDVDILSWNNWVLFSEKPLRSRKIALFILTAAYEHFYDIYDFSILSGEKQLQSTVPVNHF